jgi:hypothetical protein
MMNSTIAIGNDEKKDEDESTVLRPKSSLEDDIIESSIDRDNRLQRYRDNVSTDTLRYPSRNDLPGEGDEGERTDPFYKAFKSGHKQRKDNDKLNRRELQSEFDELIGRLQNSYFQEGMNGHTIVTKIQAGIEKNSSGKSGKNYVHVKPTWKDFCGWDRFSSILTNPAVSSFEDTKPEACLMRFLSMMRDAGWFSSDGSNGSINITWSLVDDNVSSGQQQRRKIRFQWNDLSTVSPSCSIEKSLGETR